jgi:undecaprenyl-diphosphatase
MLDYLARGFLLFSNDPIIIPLIVFGLIWLDRNTFYHAACLILLSMLVNVALKISFKIPLSPSLGKVGYAFPSGHMQLVTVLYTWLALRLKNKWLSAIVLSLLVGIGLSLIYFGYHNIYDVLAGVFFALLLVTLYLFVDRKWSKKVPFYILGTASLLLLYIGLRSTQILSYVWMAYYALWGLILAERMASKKVVSLFRSHKLLATLLCFLAIVVVYLPFHVLLQRGLPASIYQVQWLLIGFVIPCVNFCATGLINRFSHSVARNV